MGGEVGCDSAVGKGSLYWFTLDAEHVAEEPLEAEPLLLSEPLAAEPLAIEPLLLSEPLAAAEPLAQRPSRA